MTSVRPNLPKICDDVLAPLAKADGTFVSLGISSECDAYRIDVRAGNRIARNLIDHEVWPQITNDILRQLYERCRDVARGLLEHVEVTLIEVPPPCALSIVGPTPHFAELGFGHPAFDGARQVLNPDECRSLPSDDQIKEWSIAAMAKHRLLKGKGELQGRHMVLPQYDERGNLKEEALLLGRSKLYSLVIVDEFTVRRAVEATIAKIAELGPGIVWFLGAPVRTMRDGYHGDGPRGCSRLNESPRVLLVSYYGHEKQARPV